MGALPVCVPEYRLRSNSGLDRFGLQTRRTTPWIRPWSFATSVSAMPRSNRYKTLFISIGAAAAPTFPRSSVFSGTGDRITGPSKIKSAGSCCGSSRTKGLLSCLRASKKESCPGTRSIIPRHCGCRSFTKRSYTDQWAISPRLLSGRPGTTRRRSSGTTWFIATTTRAFGSLSEPMSSL